MARGLVAKVVDRLWDAVGRIDIIYICSNGSIARQNINRLNVSAEKDASLPSRITLLPTVVRGLKNRKLNFISLTPQTSLIFAPASVPTKNARCCTGCFPMTGKSRLSQFRIYCRGVPTGIIPPASLGIRP